MSHLNWAPRQLHADQDFAETLQRKEHLDVSSGRVCVLAPKNAVSVSALFCIRSTSPAAAAAAGVWEFGGWWFGLRRFAHDSVKSRMYSIGLRSHGSRFGV